MLSEYPEWARYGGVELKRRYGRNLGVGLVVSLTIHGAIIALLFLADTSIDSGQRATRLTDLRAPRADTLHSIPIILARHEGGGGSPNVKAPPGPAVKGHPQAVPEKGPHRVDPKRSVRVVVPPRPRPVDKEKPPGEVARSDSGRHDAPIAGTSGDRPDGRGTTPAGGSGGAGVGYASGIGSRGWAARPRANYPRGSNLEGTVVLRFTVMPNGDIVNVSAVKRADPALVNAAVSALRRARFRPLPMESPQVAVTGTIPFHFRLDN